MGGRKAELCVLEIADFTNGRSMRFFELAPMVPFAEVSEKTERVYDDVAYFRFCFERDSAPLNCLSMCSYCKVVGAGHGRHPQIHRVTGRAHDPAVWQGWCRRQRHSIRTAVLFILAAPLLPLASGLLSIAAYVLRTIID